MLMLSMSAFGGQADTSNHSFHCPLMTQGGPSEDTRVLVMARVAALRFPLRDEKPCISSTGPCTNA